MSILYHPSSKTFHLTNGRLSYIFQILRNGNLGQLYFGKAVRDREEFGHLLECNHRPMTAYVYEGDKRFSMDHIKREYPTYGTGDFSAPAIELVEPNGNRVIDLQYVSHTVTAGKPALTGLPATYCEQDNEAETLSILLRDPVADVQVELLYTVFAGYDALARSARIVNTGGQPLHLTRAMSLCLDLPDCDYDFIHFSGAWSRERQRKDRRLEQGVQSVGSVRGCSSHNHNPFVILKRPTADEDKGEAIGFSLIYSCNFLAQAEVDSWNTTRVLMGIHPFGFDWKLEAGESFQAPEAVIVYTADGLNALSQTYHSLYRSRLARGEWRDKPRPILINNWEATYFDFDEDKLVNIARTAHEDGVELFVLDDGWFGARSSDTAGLGDWTPNPERLPRGLAGLSERIEALGMKFGIWIEPEMVNKDSDLYRAHPDWIIHVPGRPASHGRNQYVLDFSRKEVVDCIFSQLHALFSGAKISYVKWDMNRCITECFSAALPADRQGEVFHRYILGVYDLYERLVTAFPHILFESCASGGGRFDPGILYYAPQGWCSDDSDAVERMRIQYGTSYCYPVSAIGAHVSACPNHQLFRTTPISTRANVAFFGTFGYELDLNKLTEAERALVREQIAFMKQYRAVIQFGTFYRLLSPFDGGNIMSWMVVSPDKRTAIVGYYKFLNEVNGPYRRVRLKGLDPALDYVVDGKESHYGDELMHIGLITTDGSAGECQPDDRKSCDFDSRIFVLQASDQ